MQARIQITRPLFVRTIALVLFAALLLPLVSCVSVTNPVALDSSVNGQIKNHALPMGGQDPRHAPGDTDGGNTDPSPTTPVGRTTTPHGPTGGSGGGPRSTTVE